MTLRILLVRHGQTEWNRIGRFQGRADIPLNAEGRREARALALRLKDQRLTTFYTSPLIRAVETANAIACFYPGLPVIEEPGFTEMDLGSFDGMPARDWEKLYPDFCRVWRKSPASLRMPGGESLADMQARALEALKRIIAACTPDSRVLICSHNFVILTLLCHAMDLPLDEFRRVRQGTASLNVLCRRGERLVAEAVNDRTHLKASVCE